MAIIQQLMIFAFYGILSFGITSLLNSFFKTKRILIFFVPTLIWFASFILFILGLTSPYFQEKGFIQFSLLALFAFMGSLIASFVFFFSHKR